jgi:hypothetical protein
MRACLILSLLHASRAASVSGLAFYNNTRQIANHIADLTGGVPSCQAAVTLNPPNLGVNWEGEGVQGVLFSHGTSSRPSSNRRFLLNFGSHGREYGLADLALRLVRALCDGSQRSAALLNHTDVLIIPVLNVPGRKRVEESLATSTCGDLRKNENLIDIEANFETPHWQYSQDNPAGIDYRGAWVASERQTNLLMALQQQYQPDVFIDMRATDNAALAYPRWDAQYSRDRPLLPTVEAYARHEEVLHWVVGASAGLCANASAQ